MKSKQNPLQYSAHSLVVKNSLSFQISNLEAWYLISTFIKKITNKSAKMEYPVNISDISLNRMKIFNKEVFENLLKCDITSQQVICLKYGLHDGQRKTIEQISVLMGKTHQEVRSILAKAVFSLRQENSKSDTSDK